MDGSVCVRPGRAGIRAAMLGTTLVVASVAAPAMAMSKIAAERLHREAAAHAAQLHRKIHSERAEIVGRAGRSERIATTDVTIGRRSARRVYLHRRVTGSRVYMTPYGYVAVGRTKGRPLMPLTVTSPAPTPAPDQTASAPAISAPAAPAVVVPPAAAGPVLATPPPVAPLSGPVFGAPLVIPPPVIDPYGFPVEPPMFVPPSVEPANPHGGGYFSPIR